MRRVVVLASLAAIAAGCGGGGSDGRPGELPAYAERVKLAEALGAEYPGVGASRGELGLWAGIVVQTRWQDDSGRDNIALWSLLNQTLSVEPSAYAAELAAAGDTTDPVALCASSGYGREHPTTASEGPAVDRADVCEVWMEYFVAHRAGRPSAELQELLWDAHTVALVHGLREHRAELEAAETTELERNFWASWLEMVFLLEALNFPTESATSVRASRLLMPRCSPLGAEGCELTQATLGDSLAFVSALASRPASIDRIFDLYELARTTPAALLVPRDLTLAQALSAYLAAARG